jgi:hypothetical protein
MNWGGLLIHSTTYQWKSDAVYFKRFHFTGTNYIRYFDRRVAASKLKRYRWFFHNKRSHLFSSCVSVSVTYECGIIIQGVPASWVWFIFSHWILRTGIHVIMRTSANHMAPETGGHAKRYKWQSRFYRYFIAPLSSKGNNGVLRRTAWYR